MTKAQKKNSYEDSDFQQVLDEIEGYEESKRTIRARAAGECSALSKKIEDAKKTATKLSIPKKILNTVLKQRKLEEQLQDLANDVPDDMAELYADAAGQFSFLKPEGDEKPAPFKAQSVAQKRAAAAKEAQEAEQEEGKRVLDEMVH